MTPSWLSGRRWRRWSLGLLILPASHCLGAEDRINRLIMTMNPSMDASQSELVRRSDPSWPADVRFVHGGLRLGPIDVVPRFSAGVLYDDNIYLRAENVQGDIIGTLSPGLSAGLGDHQFRSENYVTLDYAPQILFFAEESENNTIDQNLYFYSQAAFSKVTLAVSQDFQVTSGGIVEIPSRVSRRIYGTRFLSRFELTGKLSLEVNLSQTINDYQDLLGYNEWLNQNWLNFQVKPKVSLGAGFAVGYRDLSFGADQTYEQFWLRSSYSMSEKMALLASFGLEMRQYADGGSDAGPIFALGASYAPFDATTFSLSATRSEQPSVALASQNYTTTGFDIRVRQRFMQRVFATAGVGYNFTEYSSTVAGIEAGRVDDHYSLSVGMNWNMTRHLLLGLFYSHRENISNQLSFEVNQVGMQTTFTF